MRYTFLLPAILAIPFLFSCTRDPEVINNDPAAPQVELDIISRISAELSIVSTVESSDITYGGEIIQIVDGEESGANISFTTESLNENHRHSWVTENLQPNSTYIARTFITNGRNRKYSASKTYSTLSTSKPTLSIVTQEGESVVASIVDNGGRTVEDVGFVIGDTPNRKELMRKEKIPAAEQTGERFSLPLIDLPGGKTHYVIAYAIDNQEDVGYSTTPIEVFVPQTVENITLNITETPLPVGGTVTLTATVAPDDAVDKTVRWQSLDPDIASVDDAGLITGLKVGTTDIIAKSGKASAICTVSVVNFQLSFSESEREVYVGENFKLEAIVGPESIPDIKFSWESSNPSVALVTENGVVTPVGVGESTITASAYGLSASYKCRVVSEAPVFPDEAFREYVYTNFDTNHDGFLSRQEVLAIHTVDVEGRTDITSVRGIEYFDQLARIICNNCPIKELNISNCSQLRTISCSNTHISELDVLNCARLVYLSCFYTQISYLDLSHCTELTYLYCSQTQLSSLDVLNCSRLVHLTCDHTQITSLDLSGCPNLQWVACHNTQIKSLDVSSCPLLEQISCDNTQMSSLDITNCPLLNNLLCSDTQISTLDISKCPLLKYLGCNNTAISSLDISKCPLLESLSCGHTSISSLDLSNCSLLEQLWCESTQISSLDLSNCAQLQILSCDRTHVSSLDLSNCTKLSLLLCGATQLSHLDLSGCSQLSQLSCGQTQISSLDVSNCPNLLSLNCEYTQISSLDLSKCTQLDGLYCSATSISSLDLRNNIKLTWLRCQNCPLLTDVWLIDGHTYTQIEYDNTVTTLHYE